MKTTREVMEFHGLCDHGCGPARIRYGMQVLDRWYGTALLCEDCDREHWIQEADDAESD